MTALAGISELLRRSIGLDADSIGLPAIERAVDVRRRACDASDRDAYVQRLRGGGAELQALIEAVVVPETWFFRDREAFAEMARVAREQWLHAPETRVIRLLSVPSSTGEEPFSIAMALLDAGLPADRFHVDAVDVSERALAFAADGIYGHNSFRAGDLAFRDKHFDITPLGHRLKDSVRQQVDFHQGNILASNCLTDAEPYDAVFCRNLLIYFDRETQTRAIAVLRRLLTTRGTLFVAPSETGMLLNHDFESAKVPLAFAFQRRDASAVPPQRVRALPRTAGPATPRIAATPPAPAPERMLVATPADASAALNDAMRLADRGRFSEAAVCCDDQLREHGPSAGLFHLKGLLCDSAGDSAGAASFYRKALYLNPAHYDALIHLALLVEQQGDLSGAKVLKDRARRHESRATPESRAGR